MSRDTAHECDDWHDGECSRCGPGNPCPDGFNGCRTAPADGMVAALDVDPRVELREVERLAGEAAVALDEEEEGRYLFAVEALAFRAGRLAEQARLW